jgi:hypothetical protein
MGNKNHLFFFILPLFVSILGAQEYYLDRSDGDIRFVQRLTWQTEEFALCYEVVIEEQILIEKKPAFPVEADEKEEEFLEVLRDFTDTASIEFSLPAGFYRYRITVYDLLDRPGEISEWARFQIIQALEPELYSFSPEFFHSNKDGPWVLNLTGLNLSPNAEVYLRHTVKDQIIVPREYSVEFSLSNAQLVFDMQQLVPGSYEIYLKNPGGLDTSAGTFEISFHKTPDMYIGVAYTPLIHIYEKSDWYDNHPVFPLGIALRFGWVPFKESWGHLGLEFTPSWNFLSSGSGSDEASSSVLGAEVNVLYQKWLPNYIMAITFRAGTGLAGMSNMMLPQVQAGITFLWIFHEPFFMEAGIDCIHRFSDTSPVYLRPWLGVGIRL